MFSSLAGFSTSNVPTCYFNWSLSVARCKDFIWNALQHQVPSTTPNIAGGSIDVIILYTYSTVHVISNGLPTWFPFVFLAAFWLWGPSPYGAASLSCRIFPLTSLSFASRRFQVQTPSRLLILSHSTLVGLWVYTAVPLRLVCWYILHLHLIRLLLPVPCIMDIPAFIYLVRI